METFKNIKLLLIYILILILCICKFGIADSEKIPIDLGDKMFDEIQNAFLSYLSDELKSKLSNITNEDGTIEMDEIDNSSLSPEEKKEIEIAMKKAFEPIFGDFVNLISQVGIPKEAINIETKTKENFNESEEEQVNENKEKSPNKEEL